ncbi:MAG: hypothetical protein IJT60_08520 [Clostridia bacterium]|nr:hypothetical protein [Clostridia bacterium]
MNNKEIYKKTLCFSLRKLLIDLITLVVVAVLAVAGFLIMNQVNDMGMLGLAVGLVIGLVVAGLVGHFISYTIKASQIAMMTYGITENELPENVYQEGRRIVKERFATVAALFAVTKVIKAIFNQIGRGITALGNAIGGDTGGAIGSTISSAIQTVVSYMCDCCLGWVFFRKDQSSVKATLEGSVLFFKHGKALAKNVGRIFGMGLASLVLIGGSVFGICYAIFLAIPQTFATLANEIAEFGVRNEIEVSNIITNPTTLMLVVAAIIGLLIWSFVHSAFIRPFVLVGVLRNYMEAGMNDIPSENSFAELDQKSPKFAALRQQMTD